MKIVNKYHIIEIIILIFIIMFKILSGEISNDYIEILNIVFLFLLAVLLFIIGGFPKNKNYYKKTSIRIVIIIMLFYILIIYLLGFFIGFVKNLYCYDILMMLKTIFPILLFIIGSEISRYLFLKHNSSKLQIFLFTIELIILNIIMEFNSYTISSNKELFIFMSIFVLPIIAREILSTYITYNIGMAPTIIYKIVFLLYGYIVPFSPDLGDYLKSVFGIIIPFMIYLEVKKKLNYKEKYGLKAKKTVLTAGSCILIIFLASMIILISGVFKYQLIAIATGSMEPVYYRGDAVIVEKINPKKIKVDDILVYEVSGGVITHRVTGISEQNGNRVFRTKGDNNLTEDNIDITEDNVKGVVRYIVKYAGYPTIIFNELLEGK